jgi:hypothetical protein
MVHAVRPGRHRREFDFLHRDPGVLGVEPDRVEIAVLTDDLDQLRADELPDAEHPDHLPLGQQLFDPGHCEPTPRCQPLQDDPGRPFGAPGVGPPTDR